MGLTAATATLEARSRCRPDPARCRHALPLLPPAFHLVALDREVGGVRARRAGGTARRRRRHPLLDRPQRSAATSRSCSSPRRRPPRRCRRSTCSRWPPATRLAPCCRRRCRWPSRGRGTSSSPAPGSARCRAALAPRGRRRWRAALAGARAADRASARSATSRGSCPDRTSLHGEGAGDVGGRAAGRKRQPPSPALDQPLAGGRPGRRSAPPGTRAATAAASRAR